MKSVRIGKKPAPGFQVPLQVRFRDLDAMGHVNHAVYFTYLEMARTEYWMSLLGLQRPDQLGIIVVHAECAYLSPARYAEWLDVLVRVGEIRRSSFVMEYEIRARHPQRLVATGSTVQVLYDYSKKKTQTIPEALRRKIARFEKK